jgi:3-isopropylmalate dehydrogenase
MTMQMVRNPESFDVIVTNNMFGDIITDLGAALQGGLGIAASANLHPGQTSMFEPVHGSAPKYAGTGKANPVGAILSSALMLDYLGHGEACSAIEEAVARSLRERQSTPDVGGSLTTSQVGDLLARATRAANGSVLTGR